MSALVDILPTVRATAYHNGKQEGQRSVQWSTLATLTAHQYTSALRDVVVDWALDELWRQNKNPTLGLREHLVAAYECCPVTEENLSEVAW